MRGADDADRHPVEPVGAGPRARAHSARTFTRDVAKGAPKRAKTLPTRLERDVRDRPVSVPKQRRRPLDPPCEQVTMRRHTERLLE